MASSPEAGGNAGSGPPGVGEERPPVQEAILCQHCGRTASNGISCIGACVADSGY